MTDITDLSTDPVCGSKINSKDSFKYSFENNIYYFCSNSCYNSFKSSPKNYITKTKLNGINKKVTSNLDISDLYNSEIILNIPEITHNNGFSELKKELHNITGIVGIDYDNSNHKVLIKYNGDIIQEKNLLKTVQSLGYEAQNIEKDNVVFEIGGFPYFSCTSKLEKLINSQKGVLYSSVNFITEKCFISYMKSETNIENIIKIIKEKGYTISFLNETDKYNEIIKQKQQQFTQLKIFTLLSFIFSLIIFFLENSFTVDYSSNLNIQYIIIGFAFINQFIFGSTFYYNFFRAIKNRMLDINVLITLQVTSIFLFNVIFKLFPESLNINIEKSFFYISSMLITLYLLGFYLLVILKKRNYSGKSSENITLLNTENFLSIKNNKYQLYREQKYHDVMYSDISVEDIININPGDIIPFDGIVFEGSTIVDESINNAKKSVDKKKGDNILSGSINKEMPFKLQITKISNETFLYKFINFLEKSFSSKLTLQSKLDNFTSNMSPVIFMFSLIVLLIWIIFGGENYSDLALLSSTSVIAVICPCLLNLTSNFAVFSSIKKGYQNDFLFKGAKSLETCSKIDTVIFDKTGILTKAEPIITDIMTFNGFDGNTVLKIAASVENHSDHVIGNAIVNEAKNKNFDFWEPQDFHYMVGMGIEASVGGYNTLIGNKQLMRMKKINITTMERMSKKLSSEGKTIVFVAISGKAAGIIALSDFVKDDSKDVIKKLNNLGVNVVLLTGDNLKTASSVAENIGIHKDYVIAEASPKQKVKVIQSLKEQGKTVAMIRENINDIPSYRKADIVYSFGYYPNDLLDNKKVYLFSENLENIANSILLSKKAMKKIRQNILTSVSYSIIAIIFASGILFPFVGIYSDPVIVALSTLIIAIFILINSLEINKFKVE